MKSTQPNIQTLGQLKAAGYKHQTVKEELRANLITCLQNKENPFEGIFGYDDTVIPDIEKAILSKHNILLLGLRGQAKTKIARHPYYLDAPIRALQRKISHTRCKRSRFDWRLRPY